MRLIFTTMMVGACLCAMQARADERPAGVAYLGSPEAVRELCLALRPAHRVLERSEEGRASHEQERKRALATLYRISVPAQGYALGAYDAPGEKLAVDTRKPFRAFHGALSLAVPMTPRALVTINADGARGAQASWKARSGTLDVTFALDERAGGACAGQVATDVYTLQGKVVALALHDGMGAEVGRGETPLADDYRAILGGYSGTPSVRIGGVLADEDVDEAHVAGRLVTIVEGTRRCYEARLKDRPGLVGTVMLGVVVDDEGRVGAIDVVADALGDETLRACAKDAISKITFDMPRGLFRVPVEFRLVTRP